MAFITQWLNDHRQTKVADMVIDETLSDLKRRSGLLDEFIPFKTYESRHFLAYVTKQINTIASTISYGTEPPLTQQGQIQKITAQLMKTGLGVIYDEERQWEMKDAMEQAAAKNIYVQSIRDPRTGEEIRGANNDLAQYIFGTIEQIARAQVELLDKMTWEVLQTGEVNHTDPRTGLPINLSYKRPGATYNHFPSALSGGAQWNQASTANGLQDLYNAMDTYIDTNGFAPKMIVMSRKALNFLLQQQSTKDAATQVRGSSVGSVSPDLLAAAMEARGLPPIVAFDEQYTNELEGGVTSNVRYLNTNRFVFLADKMGERAMGPTLEGDGKTGVYVVTREISKIPPVDATQGVSTVLPVFTDPRLLYSQQVYSL